MVKKIIKKIVSISVLLSMFLSLLSNIVYAKTIGNDAFLENNGDCGLHLQYYNEQYGEWYYITCTYVTYSENGNEYPAYCLDKDLHGVGDHEAYAVELKHILEDARVWRVITNGYPYKTPEEMGVENKYDAFVATKQAVYCVLYGFDAATRYRGGDTRGTAIANAICKMVDIGRNGSQTPYYAGIISGTQNYAITADPYGDVLGAGVLNIKTNTGKIQINKFDSETLAPIAGVTFQLLTKDGFVIGNATTNENGIAIFSNLYQGEYVLREISTDDKYILNNSPYNVKVEYNKTTVMNIENEKIKGYLEITKVDSRTKRPIEGVTFGIYDMKDNKLEEITTDATGRATSNLLCYGKKYAKELSTGSAFYLLNQDTFEFEITKNKEIISITAQNEPVDIKVNVDKKGTIEIKSGDKVNYEFSNVGNASNVYLEEFKWFDYIPTDYIRIETMTTGTWNQDLIYSVYYKTNKSDEYVLFKEGLKTTENYELDFTKIEFTEDEYIIETCFNFGKVDVGFKEDIKPTMECKSFDTLKENDTITNYTKTVGVYFGVTAEAISKWTTITHVPEEKHEPTLPKTGK